mgnify:CR=1 FL=1
MQFKASTDYGLRAVLYLAAQGHTCSSKDIAQDMSIPRDYLIQLAQLLRNAGIIEARPGKHGGYRLANDPSKITLLQVVNALDDDAKDTTRTRRKDRADASMAAGHQASVRSGSHRATTPTSTASRFKCCWTLLRTRPWARNFWPDVSSPRASACSPKLLRRPKRPRNGCGAAFHDQPTKKAPIWGLLSVRSVGVTSERFTPSPSSTPPCA